MREARKSGDLSPLEVAAAQITQADIYAFQRQQADRFAYWAKLEYWTREESVALLLGKLPDEIPEIWKFLVGQRGAAERRYEELRRLAERAESMNLRSGKLRPADVLLWAGSIGHTVPTGLIAALDEVRARLPPLPSSVARVPVAVPKGLLPAMPSGPAPSEAAAIEPAPADASDDAAAPQRNRADKCKAPTALTTSQIAGAFDGLRYTAAQWKKPLGDVPKWLKACRVAPGVQGVSAARWDPVLIGAFLVRDGHAKARSVRAKFQTSPTLKPCLAEWNAYEAHHFDTD